MDVLSEILRQAVTQNLTAKVGLLATAIAAFFAYRAYTTTSNDAANAHMHGLFRDYLRLAYDYDSSVADRNGEEDDEQYSSLITFQLYVLEEMAAWVDKERAKAVGWIFPPYGARAKAERAAQLDAWEATILTHVYWEEVRARVTEAADCYGLNFLDLLARHEEADAVFKAWVALQEANVEGGEDRWKDVGDCGPARAVVKDKLRMTVAHTRKGRK